MTMNPNCASDDAVAARVERLGHALGLRTRVDVGDDRVLLARIEVERLVHHAVQVRDAVVGLDRERLGELEAGFLQRAQIRRLELRDDVAERVVERPTRGARVDARRVVDEELGRFGHRHRVRRVAGIEQLEAGAVVADAVEVRDSTGPRPSRGRPRRCTATRALSSTPSMLVATNSPVGDAVLQRAGVRRRTDSSGPSRRAPTRRAAPGRCWPAAAAWSRCRCSAALR